VEDRSIEPSGSQQAAKAVLTLSDRELSLLWLSLDKTTTEPERDLAAFSDNKYNSINLSPLTGGDERPR
jgi:hypothetical protein